MNTLKNKIFELIEDTRYVREFYNELSYIKAKLKSRMDDESYLRHIYRERFGKELDLDSPITFSEKQQWLKLNYHNKLYTQLVDKYRVRDYVTEHGWADLLNELYGVYDHFEEIDFDRLPEKFVIKCTHDCASTIICTDKRNFDYKYAKRKIEGALKKSYYWYSREWPYKDVLPRIIVEKYMVDESGFELKDYKFFCFAGEVKALFVATDRTSKEKTKFDFFDKEFNHLPIKNGHENASILPKKPKNYDLMVKIAEELSLEMPFVRVDLYNIDGRIIFGEYTFFHWGGLMPFEPEIWDKEFGEWLELPERII